jgi:hypothetical protein
MKPKNEQTGNNGFKRITKAKSNRQIKDQLLRIDLALGAISYSVAFS